MNVVAEVRPTKRYFRKPIFFSLPYLSLPYRTVYCTTTPRKKSTTNSMKNSDEQIQELYNCILHQARKIH